MNRRGFLAALGLAPVAAVAAPKPSLARASSEMRPFWVEIGFDERGSLEVRAHFSCSEADVVRWKGEIGSDPAAFARKLNLKCTRPFA
ncbi:twin-arginine translocation signal domain-containing protein [Chelativorans sp. AA-79]|uniref:twin-arginine translocation signal domain-containing protein n=1 Tax=Chelativorans sp. AA-79 TaxID=3028735 RepID=UPI0023F9B08D|nr:twin-arginine translocation signal domain-containing protein [Chelativorans sp. AA-79]WEX10274.1 twin-arginine translocation signal domain-containing protein [Chelativorans sp. AA-79]